MIHVRNARLTAIAIVVLVTFAGTSGAQDRVLIRVWDLQPHGTEISEALDQISQWVEAGYLPVGLEYEPGRPITVAYTQNINAAISEVSLVTIESLDRLETQMQSLLASGNVPMGMARHSDGLTFLTVRTPIPVRNWGLITVPLNVQTIEQTIRAQEERGFSAWALSDYEGEAWILFMQESAGAPPRRATVQSYLFDADNYIPGIDGATSNRLMPWGFTITGEEIYVQYTRTNPNQ